MPCNILFAEDEPVLGKLVKEALEKTQGYTVHWAKNGNDALQYFNDSLPDICILDVMMPGMDGFTLAKQLRQKHADIPILFLTARAETADVVKGYAVGGNDYLRKPFSLEELEVRIVELLRRGKRTSEKSSDGYTLGKYWFSPDTQLLRCPEATYNLSGKEAELLRQLALRKNSLMERSQVLLLLWGDDSFFNARNMDVYIARLRKYLVHDSRLSIVNIRGYGYKLIEHE